MKYRLMEWLACPRCCWSDLTLEVYRTQVGETWCAEWEAGEAGLPGLDFEGRTLTEIIEGALHCPQCAASYPIREGIPRMLPGGDAQGPASGHRWTQFDGSEPEYEANFRDMTEPIHPGQFLGQLVLDAGCGFGRHAFFAARYGAEVIALDSSDDAVASSAANCANTPRVHVIQGDLRQPPLKTEIFDTVMCMGVLHHMEEPRRAFQALRELIVPGGRLQLWVYGPRQGSIKTASTTLHSTADAMSDEQLHAFSQAIARTLRLFSHTPYRLLRNTPLLGRLVTHLPTHDHHQWPFEVLVADIYDRLRVPVTKYITGEEIERWFAGDGYADIQVTRRVRNNESFRGLGTRR